jgi:ABC-type multidrug transport system fused ATPase/permease subunit
VFGSGSAITGIAELITRDDWATKIKNDVLTLLSIGDAIPGDDTFAEGSGKFFLAMSGIAAGLTAFAGGQFVGTIANAITSLVSFFTGAENPFDQLMRLAENSDELITGATALERITNALDAFAGIKVSSIDIDFEQLATDLGKAVPFLDALANGGDVEGSAGWFGSNINFPKGILDPTLRLDEMAEAVAKVNYVLGQTNELPTGVNVTPVAEVTAPTVPQEIPVGAGMGAPVISNIDNRTSNTKTLNQAYTQRAFTELNFTNALNSRTKNSLKQLVIENLGGDL